MATNLILQDRLTLGTPKRTKDGYMAVRSKAARSGVYDYLGSEVDPNGQRFAANQVVKVYRPADEVFSKASIHSFISKPITDGHPPVSVTADNFRDYSRGIVMGATKEVLGTDEYLAFDLVLMDADTIAAVGSGKRELSNGYSCDLAFEDGIAPNGIAYQAVQRSIAGNHVAVVEKARGGSHCRIGDSASASDAQIFGDSVSLGHQPQTHISNNGKETNMASNSRFVRDTIRLNRGHNNANVGMAYPDAPKQIDKALVLDQMKEQTKGSMATRDMMLFARPV